MPVTFVALVITGLASCNTPQPGVGVPPTINVTQAYQTVEARLTQAATLTPRLSPTPEASTPTPETATATSGPTNTPEPQGVTAAPPTTAPQVTSTRQCDLAAPGNPIDVTIPDDTQMSPGQRFTKTWRLLNTGSCTWTRSYSVDFFSGEAMSGPASVPLSAEVLPGGSIDISVELVAPSNAGPYQGNWKLRNAADTWFGIGPNGDSPFWVRIVVSGSGTATLTPTAGTPGTPTVPTAATATPSVQASGERILVLSDSIDLDSGQVQVDGADLVYQENGDKKNILSPIGGANMAVFGTGAPSLAACQGASLGQAGIDVESVATGTYVCYRTGNGLVGRFVISRYNPDNELVTIEILTWGPQ